jgi:hypothetical protein
MLRMGDFVAGSHAVWEFDADGVLVRYRRGLRTPRLFQALGERRVPYAALAGLALSAGRRGCVVLRLLLRPGADPLLDAAAGQLPESRDPYRLVLPAGRAGLAGDCARTVNDALGPDAAEPAPHHLVAPPEPPRQFKAYDGKVTFDGAEVTFQWFPSGASTAKWRAGDQSFPVADLEGLEWRSPESRGGHMRLLRRAGYPGAGAAAADQDPAAVVLGLGYGPVHESLPFAACVLGAVRASSRRAGRQGTSG